MAQSASSHSCCGDTDKSPATVCAGSLAQALARPAPLLNQIAHLPALFLPTIPPGHRSMPLMSRAGAPVPVIAPAVVLRI
jgi:hypothetical protein